MKNTPRRVAPMPAGLAAVAILLVASVWGCAPSLRPYEAMRFPADPAAEADSQRLRVTFLGVSTLLFRAAGPDSTSAFMTDGFFSRPAGPISIKLGKRLRPNTTRIDTALARLGVSHLAAVIALHSHYDHAMDAPIVAKKTHARLVGSPSTAVLGEIHGVPTDTVRSGMTRRIGTTFDLTFIGCTHGPPDRYPGIIEAPFEMPASAKRYRTGDCLSLLVGHQGRSVLVTGTAGFIPGALARCRADVVYLSVGGLGKQDPIYRSSYWTEVVRATRARRVVLIHWDYFFRPLTRRLTAVPWPEDNLDKTMRDFRRFAARDSVELRLAREWVAADPFEGLPPRRPPDGCTDL